MNTLADSCRVSDDFGKFKFCYKIGRPYIGMHGSYVVCSQAVEEDITFDWGIEGSITEDTFFAMKCWEQDIRMAWIDAYMYEQSPFGFMDFVK